MNGYRFRVAIAIGAAVLCGMSLPAAAYADAGPPALMFAAGVILVFVVEAVVVLVETPVLWRLLGVSVWRSLAASVAANAASALLGWLFVVGGGSVSDFALGAWTPSWFDGPVVSIVLILLVSFTMSCLIEWPVVRLISRRPWKRSAVAVLVANAVSHALLLVFLVAWQVWSSGV